MLFLSSDKPSDILMVTEAYPYFRELYADIIKFQHEPEELASKEQEIEKLKRLLAQVEK